MGILSWLIYVPVMMLFALLPATVAVLINTLVFRKLTSARESKVFLIVASYGVLSGLWAALSGPGEFVGYLNFPGVMVGYEINNYVFYRYGDIQSSFAGLTIPWPLRLGPIFLFTSTAIWGMLGAVAQVAHNLIRRKPILGKRITILVAAALFLVYWCSAIGIFYFTQNETKRNGPTEPYVVTIAKAFALPEWQTITTWEIKSLSLASRFVKVGHELEVTGEVENTGIEDGIALVGIQVNGKVLRTQKVAIPAGKRDTAQFAIMVPLPGTYVATIGALSEPFEVVPRDWQPPDVIKTIYVLKAPAPGERVPDDWASSPIMSDPIVIRGISNYHDAIFIGLVMSERGQSDVVISRILVSPVKEPGLSKAIKFGSLHPFNPSGKYLLGPFDIPLYDPGDFNVRVFLSDMVVATARFKIER